MIPTIISNFSVNRSFGIDKKDTLSRMVILSNEFGTHLTEFPDGLSFVFQENDKKL